MASKSLGTLTLDLVAEVGGFVSGMNQAERASEKWRKQLAEDAKASTAALAGVATAAVASSAAIGAAGFGLLKSSAEQVSAVDQWAKSLKMSTQELLAWQFAAERAGLTGDNIADIFKDLGDKIGDAVLNKSGEAVEALNSLGLSAEKLSKVSPDKQMLAIGAALGKISTNAGKVTILESLGNDLSKLLPLFENNNEKLLKFIQISKDYGVAPDPSSIDDLVKVNDLFMDMEAQARGLKLEIAGGLAKADLSPLQDSLSDIRKILTDPDVLQGIVDLVSQVAQLAGWLVKAAAGAGKLASNSNNRMAALGGKIDLNNSDQIQERINWLEKNNSNRSQGMYGGGQSFIGWLTGKDDSIKAVNAELADLYTQLDKIKKQHPVIDISPEVGPQTAAGLLSFGLSKGETNGKPPTDAGAKKLENAFKALELSYQRQIALIDITGKKTENVTELQKLQFDIADGKLAGLNTTQQKRLEGLAQEVDRLNELKKVNQENLKIAGFIANLQSSNDNARSSLNADFIGAGLGEKNRSRIKEISSIQQDYLNQQKELQKQYQAGDITQSLYDAETTALQNALNERIEIQKDYYSHADELRNNWSAGINDSLADFAENSGNYYQQSADAMTSVLGSASSSVSDHLVGLINQSESLSEAVEGVFMDLGQSVIKALADMAAQWLVYQAVQLLVGKTAQASAISVMTANAQAMALQAQIAAYASTAAIPIVGPALAPAAMASAAAVTVPLAAAVTATSLAGMAHDGLDAVPETGTWLLQKGERVTTAQTSAKLDATLERVSQQSTAGQMANIELHTQVNGDPDARTLRMLEETQKAAVKQALKESASQIATGRGEVGKAFGIGWNVRRKTN